MFNHYPFVDDRLRQLLKEEVIIIHQPIFPTITITIPNVFVLRTQAMNPSIAHTIILVNYKTTWSQPITPIVPGKN